METVISDLLVPMLIGIGSAWLTLLVSRAQRRWEKREDAYKELLDALHHMRAENQVELDAEHAHWEIPENRRKELHREWHQARAIVERYADVASIVISPKVEEILVKLRTELHKDHDSLLEQLEAHGFHVTEALGAIKAEALAERRQVLGAWLYTPQWLRSDPPKKRITASVKTVRRAG